MSVGRATMADILRCEPVMLQLAPERVAGNDDNANRDTVETGEEPSELPNADEHSCRPSDEGDMYACVHKHDAEIQPHDGDGPHSSITERAKVRRSEIGHPEARQGSVAYRQGPGFYGTTGTGYSHLRHETCVCRDTVNTARSQTAAACCHELSTTVTHDVENCNAKTNLDPEVIMTRGGTWGPMTDCLATDYRCDGLLCGRYSARTDEGLVSGQSGETSKLCGQHVLSC